MAAERGEIAEREEQQETGLQGITKRMIPRGRRQLLKSHEHFRSRPPGFFRNGLDFTVLLEAYSPISRLTAKLFESAKRGGISNSL